MSADNEAIRGSLREALAIAREAVAADTKGDYSLALDKYKTCVVRLQALNARLVSEPDQLDAVRLVLVKYQQRAMLIEKVGLDRLSTTTSASDSASASTSASAALPASLPQADAWRQGDKAG